MHMHEKHMGDGIIDPGMDDVKIGVAAYPDGPTGCTVSLFPVNSQIAVDSRGGMPGTLMTRNGRAEAIIFSGGSLCGLTAASGVSTMLFNTTDTAHPHIPAVRSSVSYGFGNRHKMHIVPDKKPGEAAFRAKAGNFPPGRRGAAINASVGKSFGPTFGEGSGQDGATSHGRADSEALDRRGVRKGVFTVANALGAIHDRAGDVVRGFFDPETKTRFSLAEGLASGKPLLSAPLPSAVTQNATLNRFVTNTRFQLPELERTARQVRTSMAGAIQPVHTSQDGDILFAVTTNKISLPSACKEQQPQSDAKKHSATAAQNAMTGDRIAAIGSELAFDAVLSAAQQS